MIKKYQTRSLQKIENSFDHEMSTYYTLLNTRNQVSSTDIIITDPTEWKEDNKLIQKNQLLYSVMCQVLLWIYMYY